MIIKLLLILSLLLLIIFSMGLIITKKYPYLVGFELILGYLFSFDIFHLIVVIPTITNQLIKYVYFTAYPILLIVIIWSFILNIKNHQFKLRLNWFLFSLISAFLLLFFIFDFIIPGDSTFYLSLIRSTTNLDKIYTIEPWSGVSGNIGYMYYFVTYEFFIGSLSNIFQIDSTIFSVNVITALHLIIILATTFTFLNKIIKTKTKTNFAFIIYLLVLIFLNTNLHRVFFTHNAFNLITNSYSGKTIYLNGVVTLVFVLINKILLDKQKNDILLLGLINLITPGLTASAIFLQLIISIIIIFYFIIFHNHYYQTRFYGYLILVLLVPIMINYQFIIFAPDFYLNGLAFIVLIEVIFILITIIGLVSVIINNNWIIRYHKLIKTGFFFSLIIIGIASIIWGIILLSTRSHEVVASLNLLPNLKDMITSYGYDLLIFYVLGIISLFSVNKLYPHFKFIFFNYILIMLLVFINPFTFTIVAYLITSFANYHRILFILPLHFMIVLYLVNIKKEKLLLWIILIILPFTSIFSNLKLINQNNYFYKVPHEVVNLGHKLSIKYKILGEEDIVDNLPMVTSNYEYVFTINNKRQVAYNAYQNEELLNLYLMINRKLPVEIHIFRNLIKKYEIELIITYQNNPINSVLENAYHKENSLSDETISVYKT